MAILTAAGCATPLVATTAPTPTVHPLAIGETFLLDSHVLGERRVINVYLPPEYATTGQRYPVLYMPDGGIKEDFPHIAGLIDVSIKNEVIRPFIVVGIENTERRRDLVGPTAVVKEREVAPHAGGSDRFRRFLRDELKPHIASRYHTTLESALIGESLAGLFVVETLVIEPTLFDTYIAVDPSVWWNEQAVVRGAAARFDAWSVPPKQLYVATGDLPEMQLGVAILLDAVRDHHPAGLEIHHDPLPHEHHNTIFPVAALRAFRALFALPSQAGRAAMRCVLDPASAVAILYVSQRFVESLALLPDQRIAIFTRANRPHETPVFTSIWPLRSLTQLTLTQSLLSLLLANPIHAW